MIHGDIHWFLLLNECVRTIKQRNPPAKSENVTQYSALIVVTYVLLA